MTEHVRVQPVDPDDPAPSLHHLIDAVARERALALLPEPKSGQVGQPVCSPGPQVAVERLGGTGPERQQAFLPALAEHPADLLVKVNVRDGQAGDLRQPAPGVDQQPEQRGVTAVDQPPAGAGGEQRAELVVCQDRHGPFWHDGRDGAGHRVGVDLLLAEHPPEPLLQGAVADADGPGAATVGEVGQEGFDVLRPDLCGGQARLVAGEPGAVHLRGAAVGGERARGEVAGGEVAHPGGVQTFPGCGGGHGPACCL